MEKAWKRVDKGKMNASKCIDSNTEAALFIYIFVFCIIKV